MSNLLTGFKDLMSMQWSGRKLGSLLLFQAQASIFLAFGKISGEQWVMFTTALFTVFVIGSVYEKGTGGNKPLP